MRDRRDSHLEGGTEVQTRDGKAHRIVRGLLHAETEALGVPLRVGVTHLDHMAEAQRRVQVEHVLRELGGGAAGATSTGGLPQTLLLGDMNSLSAEDYSEGQWASHQQYNAERSWPPPADSRSSDGALHALCAAGFSDTVRSVRWQQPGSNGSGGATRPGELDRWRVGGPGEPLNPWTAHVHDPTRPPYRIDYVLSRAPTAGPRLVPIGTTTDASGGPEASDHVPVAVDFRLEPEPRL